VLLQINSRSMLCRIVGQAGPDILKALRSFTTPGTACPVTQHHIPLDFNLQLFV